MEGFVVSARKYRPTTFDSVVGQSHVTNTLKNAIKMGQLAHAFLFSGPRGVGKTTCARILAKAINCLNPPEDGEPCNECNSCQTFNEGRSLNIHELDAASNNSVEDIRKIIEQVRYVPTSGHKSVFIIDEVHMLSQAAFNAFLKTLEEPPPHAIFILATTEKHKILPTILSRVQKFDFRRIKVDSIAEHLKNICEQEQIEFEIEGLQLIGLKADGALRDALSIFDQIVSFSNKHVTYQIVVENLNVLDYEYFFKSVDLMLAQDHEGLLLMLAEIIDHGFEARDFMIGLTEHFRNLLIAKTPKTLNLLETSDNIKRRYMEQVKALPPTLLLNAFNLASESEQKMKGATNMRLHIELSLMKLAYLKTAISLAEDGEKKKSESRIKDSAVAVAPPAVSTEAPPAEAKPARLKSVRSAFSIPKSLDDVDTEVSKEDAQAEEEAEFIQYDERVNIDEKAFFEVYDILLQKLTTERNFMTASSLNRKYARLDHNKWIQGVPSEVGRKALTESPEVIMFMREKLQVPNLMLEIKIEEIGPQASDSTPYTLDEKLEKMIEKNPALKELIRKFQTFLKYN